MKIILPSDLEHLLMRDRDFSFIVTDTGTYEDICKEFNWTNLGPIEKNPELKVFCTEKKAFIGKYGVDILAASIQEAEAICMNIGATLLGPCGYIIEDASDKEADDFCHMLNEEGDKQ